MTVQAPGVTGKATTDAYRLLHRADLKVSIANAFTLKDTVHGAPAVARAKPAVHRRIRRGAFAVLYVRCCCDVTSQALPPGQLPTYALVLGDSWGSCARDAHVAVLMWVGTAIDRARDYRR